MSEKFDFDVVVIGSGFGGSVMTCRLAEKGFKVCLLERGREWKMWEFPRRISEIKHKLIWDPKDSRFGFMEVRDYPESDLMSVCASGLGGGSLIYANVLMRVPPENFKGWPGGITRETLDPYYNKVIDTMEAKPYPFHTSEYYRDTPKTKLFEKVAHELTTPDEATAKPELVFPNLAIRFEGEFAGAQSKNKHGAIQSSCVKCGECDIGCNIHAKNTLDLNYIFRAKNLPTAAEVRTHALVTRIEPLSGGEGYSVTYHDPQNKSKPVTLLAKKVVVSAGSIGTTGLLLRMKREGVLKNISHQLGKHWCGNGDLEGSVINTSHDVIPTEGPVITAAIQYKFKPYPDGFNHTAVIQDAGFPIGLAWYISAKIPSVSFYIRALKMAWRYLKEFFLQLIGRPTKKGEINVGDKLIDMIDSDSFVKKAFVLLGMGRDRNDGEIVLRPDGEPVIRWQIDGSRLHYDRTREQMKTIAQKMNGTFVDNPLTHIDKIIAVHPIGGCIMADSADKGVVGTNGEVFGHPGLYVADASVLPMSLGPNPSLTIAAVAEYFADQIKRSTV